MSDSTTPFDSRANAAPTKAPIDWGAVRGHLTRTAARLRQQEAGAETERALLARRAQELARRTPIRDVEEARIEVVAFELDGQVFGVETGFVREAVIPRDITQLPGVPAMVRGLVNVRSRVVPCFDLKSLLRLAGSRDAASEKMLIVACDGAEFGLMADRVLGLRSVLVARLRREVSGLDAKYLRGLAEDGLILLELPAIVADLQVDDTSEL